MLKNYLTTAIRYIWKNKLTTVINVIGLSVGVAIFSLIALYIYSEKKVDKNIPDLERMYRLEFNDWSLMPPGFYKVIPQVCPDVEKLIFIGMYDMMSAPMRIGENFFRSENIYSASPNAIKDLGIKVLEGDKEHLLAEPFSLILTSSYAHKLFGSISPIGQSVKINDKIIFKVTGVIEETNNLHYQINGLFSVEDIPRMNSQPKFFDNITGQMNYSCYIVINSNNNFTRAKETLSKFAKERVVNESNLQLKLRPMSDVYFGGSEIKFEGAVKHGNSRFINVMMFVALLILITAAINYINLNTAVASKRAKEIGVRKIIGASKSSLILQILSESVLLSFIAVMLGIALTELLLPSFNILISRELVFVPYNFEMFGLFALGILIIGILSGLYPAILISSFKPTVIIKSDFNRKNAGAFVRKALTIFQFTISIGLIASTLIILGQLKYFRNYSMGFAKEQIIHFPMSGKTNKAYAAFRDQVLSIPSVEGIARSNQIPGNFMWQESYVVDTRSENFTYIPTDPDYVKVMGLEIIKGRDLDWNYPSDSIRAYLINQTMAKMLGYDDPIGKEIPDNGYNQKRTIIGVIKDYNYNSLHNPIGPMAMSFRGMFYNTINVRVKTSELDQTIAKLKSVWEQFNPDTPFEYQFLNESFGKQYKSEEQLSHIFGFFAIIAVIIGSMGVFALAMFTINTRLREIGIRKVMGASNINIISILSKEYTLIVIASNAIAIPIVYVMMTKWLNTFAYKISIGIGFFIISALTSLAIAYFTVLYNSVKAANANPIDTIKYE